MDFACVVPLIGTLLGGCVSANTPGDLTFVSVQAVDWYNVAELPGPNASPVLGMVSERQLREAGESVSGGEKPHQLLLKVEFTSATNLPKFVQERSYNLGNTGFLCSRPDNRAGVSFPYIFWQGIRLGQHEPDPISRYGVAAGAPIVYYMFVGVAFPKFVPPKPEYEYDLRQKPEDVCFYVRGGSGSGGGYRSNTVIVPKAAIEAALRNLPPGFGG